VDDTYLLSPYHSEITATPISISHFLNELSTAIEAVAVAWGATRSTRATDPQGFSQRREISISLYNALPVEIDAFVTNIQAARACCESIDLFLAFPTEGALQYGISFLFAVVPHMSITFYIVVDQSRLSKFGIL
jgi:hypothetical protein